MAGRSCEVLITSKSMASGSLTEIRIDHPRRHTQGPAELANIHRTPKVSTKSNPEFQSTPKSSRTDYGDRQVDSYGRTPKVSKQSDFVYANDAYVGSVDNVNENRRIEPPTSVIREQYWACSRWPYTQRVLAIAVGVLVGAVIGLAVTVSLTGKDSSILPDFLTGHSSVD